MSYIRKEIQNPVESPYLDWIKMGNKIYEGRLKIKISKWCLSVGSRIQFYDKKNQDSYVLCEITSLKIFNDFGEAFDLLGEELIPNNTREQVIKLYNELFHYDDEIIENIVDSSRMIIDNGVVAIGLKVLTWR